MHNPFALTFLDAAGACGPAHDEMLIGNEREFRALQGLRLMLPLDPAIRAAVKADVRRWMPSA